MGWSCAAAASESLDRLSELIRSKGEKVSNAWKFNGRSYFFDVSTDKEFDDGHIVGGVFEMLSESKAVRAGSFRIEPNGWVSRFYGMPPAWKEYLNA